MKDKLFKELLKSARSVEIFKNLIDNNAPTYFTEELKNAKNGIYVLSVHYPYQLVYFDLKSALVNVLKNFYPKIYQRAIQEGCLDKSDKSERYKCIMLLIRDKILPNNTEVFNKLLRNIELIYKVLLFSHIAEVSIPIKLIKFVRDGALVLTKNFLQESNSLTTQYFCEVKSKVVSKYVYHNANEIITYLDGTYEFKGQIKNLSKFAKESIMDSNKYVMLIDKIREIKKEMERYYEVMTNREVRELVKDVYISEDGRKAFYGERSKMFVNLDKNDLRKIFNPRRYDFFKIHKSIISIYFRVVSV